MTYTWEPATRRLGYTRDNGTSVFTTTLQYDSLNRIVERFTATYTLRLPSGQAFPGTGIITHKKRAGLMMLSPARLFVRQHHRAFHRDLHVSGQQRLAGVHCRSIRECNAALFLRQRTTSAHRLSRHLRIPASLLPLQLARGCGRRSAKERRWSSRVDKLRRLGRFV